MKNCKYCGKELHDKSSFCPYCMKSQYTKQTLVVTYKKTNKWLYFVIIVLAVIVALTSILLFINKNQSSDTKSDFSSEITVSTTTKPIETTSTVATTISNITSSTTETSTQTTTEETTITTETVTTITTYEPTENTSEVIDYFEYSGVYYTDGLTEGDVKGLYGYDKIGGVELFVNYVDQIIKPDNYHDQHLDISIKLFTEYDIIEVRHVIVDVTTPKNPIVFDFEDVYGGAGTSTLLFENGKIHIKTVANDSANRQTQIVVDEWLS